MPAFSGSRWSITTSSAASTRRPRNGSSGRSVRPIWQRTLRWPGRLTGGGAGNLGGARFGTGQVAKIDMAAGKVVATYDLPDRSAAPYAVSWDEKRQVVWVANANSDAVYRVDARTGKATVFPLP